MEGAQVTWIRAALHAPAKTYLTNRHTYVSFNFMRPSKTLQPGITARSGQNFLSATEKLLWALSTTSCQALSKQ